MLKGVNDRAIEENKKALSIAENFALAHNNLALAYYHKGDIEMARIHCKKAEELGFATSAEIKASLGLLDT